MLTVLASKPSVPSFNSSVSPMGGPEIPSGESSTDKDTACSSLTSMPLVRLPANELSQRLRSCRSLVVDEGAVCAPGYMGRKRGEVVRSRTTALQMYTRQWIGTYSGKGNGDYRAELASTLQAVATYLEQFSLSPETALIRLDGQYGDAAVIAQVMRTGMHLVTRGKTYQLLERPHIQQALAHLPSASMTRKNTGEILELFEGGWLLLGEGLPSVRVIVTRYLASSPDATVKVGKHVGEWIYELFITTLGAEDMLVEDVVNLYHGRGAFETVFAEEDLEDDPDRWCSYTECGKATLADHVPMGVEYPALTGTRHAGWGTTRDGVGSGNRMSTASVLVRSGHRHLRPLAFGQRQ